MMPFVDAFRTEQPLRERIGALQRTITQPWTVMEVCGGQTHTILHAGLDTLLPNDLQLIHGPGCPVCVTPTDDIDFAIHIARQPGVTLCTFGDMLRVPGSNDDLLRARAEGADVRFVLSPLDAVRFAESNPERRVVFFAVGFETTVPVTAVAVMQAAVKRLTNVQFLVSHVRIPPAMEWILCNPSTKVNAFLAAGHVCSVMGEQEYQAIAEHYRVPVVVTGFEPVDILEGLLQATRMLESGAYGVRNAYARAVRSDGNPIARAQIAAVFDVEDRPWRGFPILKQGAFRLNSRFASLDARQHFRRPLSVVDRTERCPAGKILSGLLTPDACPHFGRECSPEHPIGAPMVSAEGTCAAFWNAGRARLACGGVQ